MLSTRSFLALALSAALCACASMGNTPARDLQDRMAYTQAGVTAVRQTAANMLDRQRIGKARAQELLAQTNEATSTVALARSALASGDITTAQGKVNAAVMLLTVITSQKKDAMEAANIALDLLIATQNAQAAGTIVSQMIEKAKLENRPLNAVDWATLESSDSAARQQLETGILAAK